MSWLRLAWLIHLHWCNTWWKRKNKFTSLQNIFSDSLKEDDPKHIVRATWVHKRQWVKGFWFTKSDFNHKCIPLLKRNLLVYIHTRQILWCACLSRTKSRLNCFRLVWFVRIQNELFCNYILDIINSSPWGLLSCMFRCFPAPTRLIQMIRIIIRFLQGLLMSWFVCSTRPDPQHAGSGLAQQNMLVWSAFTVLAQI